MEIIKFLQSFSGPFLDMLFQIITFLGEQIIFVLVIVIMYWCLNKKTGLRLAFILLFSSVSNGAIKDIVRAPRPIGKDGVFSLRVHTATGYSFPSGHTQGTTTFWAALMKIYKRSWLYALGSILIICVAISRLYLGVHWPQDVAAAIVFGIISMLIANKIVDLTFERKNHKYMLILVLPALLGLMFFPSKDYVKAAATVTGFYLGYMLEDKYISFSTETSLLNQILKVVIGLLGVGIIKLTVKFLLPDNNIEAFVDYSLMGLWITFGAPFIFTTLGLSSSKTKINKIYKSA